MNSVVKIGDLLFCFKGTHRLLELYFPNLTLTKNESFEEFNYVIIPKGKMNLDIQLPNSKVYHVENFMGSKYDVYEEKGIKYYLSTKNEFGNHLFVVSGKYFEVYSMEDNCWDDYIWSVRLCRELLMNYYFEKGYVPLHSSAVNYHNKGIISIGVKGSGKTTMLCALAKNGSKILSNDFILIGCNNRGIEVIGWPWKITIGNSLAEILKLDILESKPKVDVYPQKFCELFDCKWRWQSKVNIILFPKVVLNEKLLIYKIPKAYSKEKILSGGIEYKKITNIFSGKEYVFDFEDIVNKLMDYIPCYSVCGDIWKYADILEVFLKDINNSINNNGF